MGRRFDQKVSSILTSKVTGRVVFRGKTGSKTNAQIKSSNRKLQDTTNTKVISINLKEEKPKVRDDAQEKGSSSVESVKSLRHPDLHSDH